MGRLQLSVQPRPPGRVDRRERLSSARETIVESFGLRRKISLGRARPPSLAVDAQTQIPQRDCRDFMYFAAELREVVVHDGVQARMEAAVEVRDHVRNLDRQF